MVIHTLDDVLSLPEYSQLVFPVAKLDVQGYECNAICGGIESILKGKIKTLHTEIDNELLFNAGCSYQRMIELLSYAGFNATSSEHVCKYDPNRPKISNKYGKDIFLIWEKQRVQESLLRQQCKMLLLKIEKPPIKHPNCPND